MSPIRMERLESSIRIVLAYREAFNRQDISGILQLLSDDCVFDRSDLDKTIYSGKEAISKFWQIFFRESPSAHLEIEEIFGLGNRCVMRWTFNQIDAAEKTESVRGVDLFKVKNELICEKLSYGKG